MAPYRPLYVPAKLPRRQRALVRSVEPRTAPIRPRSFVLGVAGGTLIACATASPLGLLLASYAAVGVGVYLIAS